MVDIGANLGDSALQVLSRTHARVLCVEGDPYWLDFLERMSHGRPDVSIEPALLVGSSEARTALEAVRGGGTTHFIGELRYVDSQDDRLSNFARS